MKYKVGNVVRIRSKETNSFIFYIITELPRSNDSDNLYGATRIFLSEDFCLQEAVIDGAFNPERWKSDKEYEINLVGHADY